MVSNFFKLKALIVFHNSLHAMKTLDLTNGYRIHHILKERSNAFVVEASDQLYLIDSGRNSYLKTVLNSILNLQSETGKLAQWLLLTHTHYDHSGGAAELKKELGIKVVVGKPEVRFLKHGFTPLPEGTNLLTGWVSDLGRQMSGKGFEYPPVRAYKSLSHEWEVEPAIRVIMTPGHTKGSMSIVVNDEVAIVGDTLSGLDQSHIMPPYADDINELLDSWSKLLATPCHSFLPGHGNVIKRAELELEYNKFVSFKAEKD